MIAMMLIFDSGGSYAFNPNVKFVGEYAQNTEADEEDQAWTAELQYKGANPADAGSWGMYAGYRQIEAFSAIAPTYDDIIGAGYKGAVVGASYVPAENILATVQYFDGEETYSGRNASKFFANINSSSDKHSVRLNLIENIKSRLCVCSFYINHICYKISFNKIK